MDASNPLSVVQDTSPTLPTVQPSSGVLASIPVQAPQMSAMMQNATLQQLNLQQALLMQQYALAQQAVSKAATIKSPAEVAAARAAEISKQLKEIDAPEKSRSVSKSASRSHSRSASRSPSRSMSKSKSKSKSRSRSPVRYRRGRSGSRSPIRYRRDYYSSYRSRDHYGYRGYNYRNYNRGSYNDYSRYRYGRDRDYQYRRRSRSRERRRSRTKSRSPRRDRSRGQRRSLSVSPPTKKRSHTRSPKDSQKESVSPLAKRDGPRSRHTPKQSVSREAARSHSVSSGSVNAVKSRSRSPSQAKPVGDYNVGGSPPTELSYESDDDRTAVNYRKHKKGSSVSSRGRMQSSSSPTRSLSISLDNQGYKIASNEGSAKRRSSGKHHEAPKQGSSDEHDETPDKNYIPKLEEAERGKKNPGEGRRVRKLPRSPNAIFYDDSESNEVLDDWRDDLQNVVKGKGMSAFKAGEIDKHKDRGKSDTLETQMAEMDSSVKVILSDFEPKHERIVHSASSEGHVDSLMAVGEQQDASLDKGYGPAIVHGEGEFVLEERRPMSVLENAQEVCDDGYELERASDEEVIFEGPKPANPGYDERLQWSEAVRTDTKPYFIDVELPSDKKKTEGLRNVEDDNGTKNSGGKIYSHEENVRGRSRSKDGRKHEGEISKHEKRKDRHKKHRKKHRRENADADSAKSEGARRRHKRKHRKEGEHGHKERKKRKHKHRARSSSISADDTSSDGEGEVRSSTGKRKRGSKKHKVSKRDVLESPPLSASLG